MPGTFRQDFQKEIKMFNSNIAPFISFQGALALMVGCPICASARKNIKTDRPNFIIVMTDDMGYSDIGCFGSDYINTPNLDKMAKEGLMLTDYHSNGPVSTPTRAALLTGRYQQRAGLEHVLLTGNEQLRKTGLKQEEVTFAEILKENGYNVAMFGKWHLGYEPQFCPPVHGFDEYIGFHAGNVDYKAFIDQAGNADWWKWDTPADTTGYLTQIINRLGIDYIKRNDGTPFCLYLAHGCPHSPYQGPDDPPLREVGSSGFVRPEREDKDIAYKEMIEFFDKEFGLLMKTLKKEGLDKNTMVIFVSDNGPTGPGKAGIFRGRKGSVFEGGHRVPAIIWMPGTVKPGTVSDETVMTMDIFPTMLDYAGIKYDDSERPLDGTSFRPVIENGKMPVRPVFWRYGKGKTVRVGDIKYIEETTGGKNNEKVSTYLFDLGDDPSETNNIINLNAERAKEMKTLLDDWEIDVL